MEQYQLIYDDRCGLCRAWVRWVVKRNIKNLILPVPCSEYLKNTSTNSLECDEVILILPDGSIFRGGSVIPMILQRLPKYRIIGKILGWKIMRLPLNWGYKVLARKRLFLSAILGDWTK
jgi:predicted DCC family thiol-disulfide oxidoreductase YuxK